MPFWKSSKVTTPHIPAKKTVPAVKEGPFVPAPTFSTLGDSSELQDVLAKTKVTPNFISRGRTQAEKIQQLGVSHPVGFITKEELALVERQEKGLHSDLGKHFHDLLLLYTTGAATSLHLAELRGAISRYSVDISKKNQVRFLYRGLTLPPNIIALVKKAPKGPAGRSIAHQLLHGFRYEDGSYSGKGVASTSTFRPVAKIFAELDDDSDDSDDSSDEEEMSVLLKIKAYGTRSQTNQHGARGVTVRESRLPRKYEKGEHEIILDLTNRYEIDAISINSKGVMICEMRAYGPFSGNEAGQLKQTDKWVQETAPAEADTGEIFRDAQGGRWYLKEGTEAQLRSAYLANLFYAGLGLAVPETQLVTRADTIYLASKVLEVKGIPVDEPVHGLHRGFIADAWLANWGVIGLEGESVKIGKNGNAVRLSTRGALLYRLQSLEKGAAFGNEVNEIYTFIDGSNAQTAMAYRNLKKSDIRAGILQLRHFSNAAIREQCDYWGPGSVEMKTKLGDTLIARRDWLVAQLAAGLPHFHEKPDSRDRLVMIHKPSTASPLGHWSKPSANAAAVASLKPSLPETLNKVALKRWVAPDTLEKWDELEPEIDFEDPLLELVDGRRAASGMLIVEPDGRLWLVEPTNHRYGAQHSFAKGDLVAGLKLKANAMREAYKATGLQVKITGLLGDYARTETTSRYYLGKRIGGTPAEMGAISQSVKLVTFEEAEKLCELDIDKTILADLRKRLDSDQQKAREAKEVEKAKEEEAQKAKAASKKAKPAVASESSKPVKQSASKADEQLDEKTGKAGIAQPAKQTSTSLAGTDKKITGPSKKPAAGKTGKSSNVEILKANQGKGIPAYFEQLKSG